MREGNAGYFYDKLCLRKRRLPLTGHLELTYRCNLSCIHCYAKGSENKTDELDTRGWKKILATLKEEGCLWITITGGEPLLRGDFLEIYSFAKENGFIISIFTNAGLFSRESIKYLTKLPPSSIEITLNGINRDTYEAITQASGSFSKAMENIKILAENKLPLVLKVNCLKQNKNEIAKIKRFADKLLGRPQGRYYFKYDTLILPRLNADKTPVNFRLDFRELTELKKSDADIWGEYRESLRAGYPVLEIEKEFLYPCNSWKNNFFINPYGRLKFCQFSDKFSADLRSTSFREGFYRVFPGVLKERFKTGSKCRNCRLRPLCHNCPARAYLETGDEEAPVPYFCKLAKQTAGQIKKLSNR